MPRKKLFSIREAVAMVIEDDDIEDADIVVLPPSQVDAESDCEPCDESDLLPMDSIPADIAGLVEVHYVDEKTDVKEFEEDENPDEEPVIAAPRRKLTTQELGAKKKRKVHDTYDESQSVGGIQPQKSLNKQDSSRPSCEICSELGLNDEKQLCKTQSVKVKWSKQKPRFSLQPTDVEKSKNADLTELLIEKSEVELFQEFWDDDMLSFITQQSILYAQQENRHDFNIKPFELKRFLGFLLFSGYHKLPREEMYWENADDCNIKIVTNAMSRQKYKDIKRNIHLADNSMVHSCDKLYKVRQYTDKLNKNFMKFGVFSHNLSVDEQMIPYFGRHSCKMFMQGKPVRFGFKVWCLCSADGYLFQFIPYVGRDKKINCDLGLGASVVLQLLDVVNDPQNHAVYFDNFFTSHKLMVELLARKFCATGTVREPRLIDSSLMNSQCMKKQQRGSYDCTYDKVNHVVAVKWNDNAVVTLASNFQSAEPLLYTKRYSRTEKKIVSVSQPNLISSYNANMGGVDMLDNFVAKYRVAVKGKKWWWPIFLNYIDVSLCNAWSLHRRIHGKGTDLLEFRRRVAIALLSAQPAAAEGDAASNNENLAGRPSQMKALSDPRLTLNDHWIIKQPEGRRLRCRQCKSTTFYICATCNIGMHAKCFADYHASTK